MLQQAHVRFRRRLVIRLFLYLHYKASVLLTVFYIVQTGHIARFCLISGPRACAVCNTPYIILFMPKSSSLFFFFCQNPLVPILLVPFIVNPPSKKHRRENERQKWWRAKSLRGEGPIKQAPFPSKECAQRWREMKEVKKKPPLYSV